MKEKRIRDIDCLVVSHIVGKAEKAMVLFKPINKPRKNLSYKKEIAADARYFAHWLKNRATAVFINELIAEIERTKPQM